MSRPFATLRRRGYTAALLAFRRMPAGVRRGLVRAGTPGYTVGAVCLLQHDGRLLFLRQPHREGWSLPGGLLGRGETAEDAVAREVREETGIEIEPGLPSTVKVNPALRRVDVIFHVPVSAPPRVTPGGEAEDARWLHPDDVLDDADGPTLEILELARPSLGGGASVGRVVGPSPS
jgi:ADP-ribose pyrophosphatase YjhB (NUDIX family)